MSYTNEKSLKKSISVQLIFLLFSSWNNEDRTEQTLRRLGEMQLSYNKESFLKSAEQGNIETIRLFLNTGMNPNVKNNLGDTALMLASANDFLEIVKVFIDAGAKLNTKSTGGMTVNADFTKPGIKISPLQNILPL
ncbi:ankyrin repeat domain-containing protein [Desulfobacterales bacterium HSG17]|nr:ankyrin repeat domain-containing protein [Desulfobacterales bacterium HSG17]